MRRLRQRIQGLENHAHSTMSSADQLIAIVKDLIEDLQDGISISVSIAGKELPIVIKIDPKD